MNEAEQDRFDGLMEQVLASLPGPIHDVIEEVPIVVLDVPDARMQAELEAMHLSEGDDDELAGLHTGVAWTEMSVEDSAELPSLIHLFRHGIVELAGGWEQEDADDRVREEIRVTILHEIGHQFGLDEEDLDDLGYA